MNNMGFLLNGYEVSIAKNSDEDQIISLLKSVARWLKGKGIEQWGFLAGGGDDDEIRQAISNQETFTVRKDEKLIATFTLYHTQSEWDQNLWGNLNDASVYLHKLAISKSEMGSGVGKEILDWIDFFLKNKNRNTLRLDCIEDNIKLNNFYLHHGFEKVGINKAFSLFEKRYQN